MGGKDKEMDALDMEVRELGKTEEGREMLASLLGRGIIIPKGKPTVDERLAIGFGMLDEDNE